MSQELQLFLIRFLAPSLFAAIGGFLLTRATPHTVPSDVDGELADRPSTGVVAWKIIFGVFACSLSLVISDLWARNLLWSPQKWTEWDARYQWNWLVWLLPTVFLLLALLRVTWQKRESFASALWPVLFLFAIVSLYISLMEREAWGDQINRVLDLILLGLVAIIANTAAINNFVTSRANRWAGLVLMGQFGCVAAVALQTYASLGELALVGAAMCFGLTIATLTSKVRSTEFGEWQVAIIAFPLASMAVCIFLLSGFFQSKPLLPDWLFYVVLFLPSITWFFDYVYGRYGRVWWRITLSALVTSCVIAAILTITNPFASEW